MAIPRLNKETSIFKEGSLSSLKTSIQQNSNAILLRATKNELNDAINTFESEILLTNNEVSTKVSANGVISSINQSPESITIDASRVNIAGAALFASGRLSETNLNSTYASKSSANGREQAIYISKESGTLSVESNTNWVTVSSDTQNVWTTMRPTYNASYPILFVATQRQTVAQMDSATCTCTVPVIDQTTTVIDGGHITAGTIDTARLNASTITSQIVQTADLNANKITSGYLAAERIESGSLNVSHINGLSNTIASINTRNGRIETAVTSLAAANATYTDVNGDSATNNLYSKITQTASDLTVTIASGTSYYATSTTAAGTTAKTATTMRDTSKPQAAFDLVVGVNVRVLFSQANTAASPTLNVDSKGAKPICVNNAAIASGSPYNWAANTIVTFVYDGTYWQMSEATALGIASAGKATADTLATIVRVYNNGVLVGKSGNAVGALVNSSGSFDVVPVTWSGTTPTAGTSPLASFGSSSIKLGSSGYNMELTSSSLTFKNGTTTLQQLTGTANTMYVSGKQRMVLNSSGLTLYDSNGSTVIGQLYANSTVHGNPSYMHVSETYAGTKYTKEIVNPVDATWSYVGKETWEASTATGQLSYEMTLNAGDTKGPKIGRAFNPTSSRMANTISSPTGIDYTLNTYQAANDSLNLNSSWLHINSPGSVNGSGNNVFFSAGSNLVISSGEIAHNVREMSTNLYAWSDTGERLYLMADNDAVIYSNAQDFLNDPTTSNSWRFGTDGQLVTLNRQLDRSSATAPSTTTDISDYLIWRDKDNETIGYVGPRYQKAYDTSTPSGTSQGNRYVQLYCRTTNDANNGLSMGFDYQGNRIVEVTSKPAWQNALGLLTPKSLSSTNVITINSTCTLSAAYMRVSYASVVTVYIKFKVTSAQATGTTVTVGTLLATTTDDNVYYLNLRPNFDIRADVNETNCLANINSSGVVTFWNNTGSSFSANAEHVITATYVTKL